MTIISSSPAFDNIRDIEQNTAYSPTENQNVSQPSEDYLHQPNEKDHSSDPGASDDDVRKIKGYRWFLICAALYLSALMYGLDTTIAADIQGAVIQRFGQVDQLAWIGTGFPLGSVAVIPPYEFLFTTFNMKWLYIARIVLFQGGSAVCGGAPNMGALIVGRVIAGAGGTGIYLGGLNHFSAMTTQNERGTYLAGTGFVWGLGAILGPVVGGGFSDSSATWRWGFYINLIIGAITLKDRLLSLGYVGFMLSAAMWATFAMGLIFAGGIWQWNDGRNIAMLVLW
ncbi:unnamed protein product [Penicillium egyptiacum]|uniref:Major facilitator superfamily (MFS) profile domain-containing protein n=1 Tax=Penicillium egyptiacum TaxID=1303716 RepID=A0A9W4P366_9EURO|nr:unnamed protein product [Penicillium egyptiacum]